MKNSTKALFRMQRWLFVFSASRLIGIAASRATFVLWPQHINATLSLSISPDNSPFVEASHGGVLSTFDTKFDTKSKVALDPLIDAIEIKWKPATDVHSSTFNRFLASSSRFDGINAVGIHLHVDLRKGVRWIEMNTTFHKRIEENVRKVLDNIVPSVQILPNFLKDFLAKSFCNHATWKSSNSPERIFHEDASKSQTLCYSSSFPFWPENDNSSFFHNLFQKSNANTGIVKHSITERALLEAHRNLRTCRQEPIIAALKLSRRETSPATLEATFFGSYIVRLSCSDAADRTAVQVRRSTSDKFFVTPIISKDNIYELEYAWLQRNGEAVSVESALTTPIEVQVMQPVAAALMHAAIIGEGFHRRYVIDVKVLKHEGCGEATRNNTILLRVPISNTAYIDLDELRRMERFNELKLVSFTKHIEIERPSPVSAQHVIVLEFPMSLSNQIHIEYPIHFRYQAPSETESYRQAFVIAPDIFIKCLDKNPAARNKLKPIRDDVVRRYFQTWGISNQENWFSDSDWINLAAVSPLPALQISIPVGYLPSRWLVSYVTLMATIVSAAIIIWFSYREAYGVPKAWGKFEPSWKSKDN